MANGDNDGRRLDDRIKVVAASVLLGALPVGAFLFTQISSLERDLASYKLQAAKEYVCVSTYGADMGEIKALLREMRDEIRQSERRGWSREATVR